MTSSSVTEGRQAKQYLAAFRTKIIQFVQLHREKRLKNLRGLQWE